MYKLPWSSAVEWVQRADGGLYPRSIDTNCPRCGRMVNLLAHEVSYDGERQTTSATLRCPRCRQGSFVWIVEHDSMYIHPTPQLDRQPIEGYEALPERLQRAYKATLDVYNANVWTATANSCRRTLEGIVSELQPDAKGPLAQQLRELADNVDLAEPLVTLSQAVKEGGNLGSHFDLEKEPDREISEAMLELVEYFLEYVYTLPREIEDLNQKLEALGQEDEEQAS